MTCIRVPAERRQIMKKWTALLVCSILTLSLGGCAESARSLGGKITETEVYKNDESFSDMSGALDESKIPDEKVSEEAAKNQAGDKKVKDQSTSEEAAKDQSGDKKVKDQSVAEEAAKDQAGDKKAEDKPADESEPEKIIQKVYLQDHFGYKLTLDEDWVFANDRELKELNDALKDSGESGDTLSGLVDSDNLYTDMMASDTVTGNTIVIRLVRENLADVVGSKEKRNDALADAMYADAEAAGLKKIEKTTREVTFLGEPVTAIGVKGQLALSDEYSTEMWYQMIVKRKGVYASVIFVTGFTEFGGDNYQEILDCFEVI